MFGEAQRERYSLPLNCAPGEDCFVQKYVDVDAGDGIADHTCGRMTSPEHTGTDFRIPPGASADVLAVADGTVRRVRDGQADRTFVGPLAVPDGVGCGNGLAIEHADGTESLYCHLERGSLRVAQGDTVARGDPVGHVGASGLTEFRHVHLALRRDGRDIDPFTGHARGRAACDVPGSALWTDEAAEALAAAEGPHVLALGFHDRPVTIPAIEDAATVGSVTARSDALVAWGLAIAVEAGDVLSLTADGPGLSVDETHLVDRPQAQTMRFVGRRMREGVPPGTYRVALSVSRNGEVMASRDATLTIR